MSERVPPALRQAVIARARMLRGCCEDDLKPDDTVVRPHEPDHVIAVQRGGPTALDNLAYARFDCDRRKGPNLAAIDPLTGPMTPLFDPRTQCIIPQLCT